MKNLILISALLSVFSMSAITFADNNINKYYGATKGGKPNGQGKMYFADGDQYVGEFKDGKRHGKGTYFYADGDKYVGQWQYDKKHGQGTYTFSSGRVNSGIYENDKYIGTKKDFERKREAERRRYEAEENQRDIILNNCLIDLTKVGMSNQVQGEVFKKCYRISGNPSTWQKWKYSD